MADYQIFTDATADLTDELMANLPQIITIPMEITVGDTQYIYGLSNGISADRFYDLLREGGFATTSQINPSVYTEMFENTLSQGKDIVYICFSSGLSGTYQSAMLAIEDLKEQYHQRNIYCIDSRAACGGEGFLVREAAKMQLKGLSAQQLSQWIEENKLNICHWFTVDTFTFLKHGGRVSSSVAAIGTALSIKPLLHVDCDGKLQAMEKPRGRQKALAALMAHIESGWQPQYSRSVIISHASDKPQALALEQMISERFPDAEIFISDMGPIIGAHTGPGALALFYWGNNR